MLSWPSIADTPATKFMLQSVFLSQCYGFYCVEVARKLLNFLMKQFVVAMHWKLTFYLFFKPLLCTTAMHGQYNISPVKFIWPSLTSPLIETCLCKNSLN